MRHGRRTRRCVCVCHGGAYEPRGENEALLFVCVCVHVCVCVYICVFVCVSVLRPA